MTPERRDLAPGRRVDAPPPADPLARAAELAASHAHGAHDPRAADPLARALEFEASLPAHTRHAHGVHYTHALEILRVLEPTLIDPWQRRIDATATTALPALHAELASFRVLDPACGAGNFLHLALAALRALESRILARAPSLAPRITLDQLRGIDIDPDALALARAALLRTGLPGDPHLVHADALFCDWPAADAIVGNPPFLAKNKARAGLGAAYLARLRRRWPDVPGRADLCVHWIRRAHDHLPPGGRAGMIATNTIRDNDSRRAGLEYILARGATITDAVATQVWPAAAVVHVSIVNWIKADVPGPHRLWDQPGDTPDAPWRRHELPRIPASLSARTDVTAARDLACNLVPKTTFQGQTPGHRDFLLDPAVAAAWRGDRDVLFPYLIGDDLLDNPDSAPARFIVDLGPVDLPAARRHRRPLAHLEALVLPARRQAAAREAARNAESLRADPAARTNHHHRQFLERWWLPAFRREDMLHALHGLSRYIACSRVTRRPIFEFVDPGVRPGDALQVFALDDDYSFGVLQSDIHWQWFVARCSGLKIDPRYTSRTVYTTFPWPQRPSLEAVEAVATAAQQLRRARRELARTRRIGLRELYRSLEAPGAHPLAELHARLDAAVRRAYAMTPTADPLAFLLELNNCVASAAPETVQGPGWPTLGASTKIVTEDRVTAR